MLSLLHGVVDPSHGAHATAQAILQSNPGWTPGIIRHNWIRHLRCYVSPHSTITRIPQPSAYVEGLAQSLVGLRVFQHRLNDLVTERRATGVSISAQTASILQQCQELQDRYGDRWEDPKNDARSLEVNQCSIAFLDDLHARHNTTTSYFQKRLLHKRMK